VSLPPVTGTAATGSIQAFGGSAVKSTPAAGGVDFSAGFSEVLDATGTANELGQQLATGDLTDLHEFTASAARASIALEMTVAVRNQALQAYQEIMRMQV
jgi:flagellar hook-basal body complex protein FliE